MGISDLLSQLTRMFAAAGQECIWKVEPGGLVPGAEMGGIGALQPVADDAAYERKCPIADSQAWERYQG